MGTDTPAGEETAVPLAGRQRRDQLEDLSRLAPVRPTVSPS
jgi:hypothetical protein